MLKSRHAEGARAFVALVTSAGGTGRAPATRIAAGLGAAAAGPATGARAPERPRPAGWWWLTRRVLRVVALALGAALVLLLGLPLLSLVLRVSPGELLDRVRQPLILEALRLSLITSLAATAIVVALGLPVAYALRGADFRGKRALEVLIDLPMVLPPTVAGVALLTAFGRTGLAGRALAVSA